MKEIRSIQANQRIASIDLLRFVGISLIILAHTDPPQWLFQIRCFDVPLLIFVSGLSYANREPDFSFRFMWKRIKRLLVPTYLFLTVYFSIILLLNHFSIIEYNITPQQIAFSYLLWDGIGYVWIIRVFLILGLLTPCLIVINRLFNSIFSFLFFFLAILVLLQTNFGIQYAFIREVLYYALGYGAVFVLGLRIKDAPQKDIRISVAFVFILLALCATYFLRSGREFLSFNNFKFPPRPYFLLWGSLVSLLLYYCSVKWPIKKLSPPIGFVASHTMWIYLYHIPFVTIFEGVHIAWYLKYIIVFVLATLITFIQDRFVHYLKRQGKDCFLFPYLIG